MVAREKLILIIWVSLFILICAPLILLKEIKRYFKTGKAFFY